MIVSKSTGQTRNVGDVKLKSMSKRVATLALIANNLNKHKATSVPIKISTPSTSLYRTSLNIFNPLTISLTLTSLDVNISLTMVTLENKTVI